MILLIFALLSVTLIALWLAYELVKCQKRINYKNDCLVAREAQIEEYWLKLLKEQSRNRSKALLIKELNEEIAELEQLLAHKELELDNANSWADGWEEVYNRVAEEWRVALEEKEELECKVDSLTRELDVYYEANKDLQNQLADALHEAESFRELAKERSEEIEKQKEQIKSLKNELENEFDWSMRYSESVDKYGALYLETLQKAEELEAKNEHLKLELQYYRQKFDGDYDPIE